MTSMTSEDATERELFAEFRRTGSRSVRNELVERHMGLAIHIAQRFNAAARRDHDIEQVALLALVKAVDRYDPEVGVAFSSFAGRTIEGEIKRHFRDATWALKVPRGAKELHLAVRRANEELTRVLGRSPSVEEVAEHLQIDRDDVIVGLAASMARTATTIDPGPTDDMPGGDRLVATATVERGFGMVDDEAMVDELLGSLPERERKIVELRFFEELSQSEIAARVGVSQMHVSRLLRKAIDLMRSVADPDGNGDDVQGSHASEQLG